MQLIDWAGAMDSVDRIPSYTSDPDGPPCVTQNVWLGISAWLVVVFFVPVREGSLASSPVLHWIATAIIASFPVYTGITAFLRHDGIPQPRAANNPLHAFHELLFWNYALKRRVYRNWPFRDHPAPAGWQPQQQRAEGLFEHMAPREAWRQESWLRLAVTLSCLASAVCIALICGNWVNGTLTQYQLEHWLTGSVFFVGLAFIHVQGYHVFPNNCSLLCRRFWHYGPRMRPGWMTSTRDMLFTYQFTVCSAFNKVHLPGLGPCRSPLNTKLAWEAVCQMPLYRAAPGMSLVRSAGQQNARMGVPDLKPEDGVYQVLKWFAIGKRRGRPVYVRELLQFFPAADNELNDVLADCFCKGVLEFARGPKVPRPNA